MNARFLTHEENYYAVATLASRQNRQFQQGVDMVSSSGSHPGHQALANVLLQRLHQHVQWCSTRFKPLIIPVLGFSNPMTCVMLIPCGLADITSSWVFSLLATRWRNRGIVVICVGIILPLLGTIVVHSLLRTNKAAQIVGPLLIYRYVAKFSLYYIVFRGHLSTIEFQPLTNSPLQEGHLSVQHRGRSAYPCLSPIQQVTQRNPWHTVWSQLATQLVLG